MTTADHDQYASELLERDLTPADLREATARVAAPLSAKAALAASALIFRIGSEWFALSTSVFDEVSLTRQRHALPHRGGMVAGVVNIRGELLPCIRLAVLLGVETSATSAAERIVVIHRDSLRITCIVDEVSEIHRYDPAGMKPLPSTVHGAYVDGLVTWKDRTAGRLDEEILFYGIAKGLA